MQQLLCIRLVVVAEQRVLIHRAVSWGATIRLFAGAIHQLVSQLCVAPNEEGEEV